jgi:antitoxin (DNA-binding transcriptional repressor) of toxin-antitoxin stability system
MFTTLLVAAATAPAAPVPADTNPAPAGPAPWVVHLKADDANPLRLNVLTRRTVKQTVTVLETVNGQAVQKQVVRDVPQMQSAQVTLADLAGTVTAADGSPVGPAELVRRAKAGVTVLISADGKAIDRAWLRAVAPNTVVVAADALAGATNPPQPLVNRPAVTTQPPRLTLLAAGDDGTVRVTTQPGNGGRYIGSRVVFMNNGNGVMPAMLDDGVGFAPNGGTPQTRPLSEVGFDAYDLAGRLVEKAEAVRRLRAGGLVLVAGDGRFPDPAFLQPFRGDLLVLVSGEHLTAPGAPTTPSAPLPPGMVKPGIIRVMPVAPLAVPAAPVPAPAPILLPARPALRVAPAQVLPAAPAVEKPVR